MTKIDQFKIRIFGSHGCPECDKLIKAMRMHNLDYEFLDAMADDLQDFCDKHNVDDLPHIQVYLVGADDVLFEKTGYVSPIVLLQYIGDAQDEKRSPTDVKLKGVRWNPASRIGPIYGKGQCHGCKDETNKDGS